LHLTKLISKRDYIVSVCECENYLDTSTGKKLLIQQFPIHYLLWQTGRLKVKL